MDEKPGKRLQFGLKALLSLVVIVAIGAAIYRAVRINDGYRPLADILRAGHSNFRVVEAPDQPGPYRCLGVWRFPKGVEMGGGVEGRKSFSFPADPDSDTRVLGLETTRGKLIFVLLRRKQYEKYGKYGKH